MRTIYITISVLACFLLNTSCTSPYNPDEHYRIMFVNNSEIDVFVRADWLYPDTLIAFGNPAKAKSQFLIKANSNNGHPLSSGYPSYENNFSSINDTCMVFVMDAELVKNTPWDTVKAKYLVLKRYDLSFHDLDSMNWTITYQ